MITARWLERRKPFWNELESLLERSGSRGIAALHHRELQQVSLLYRQVAADLAAVREDSANRRLAEYLNQLLGRAHNLIYMDRRASVGSIWSFYRDVFPGVFRATFSYTLAAFVIFCSGALTGFLACLGDPSFQRFFLGDAMNSALEHRRMWTESIVTVKPLASSAILTNNLTVSFTTFALGLTAGLGTVYMLAMNGLLIGVVTAACWQAGMVVQLASFVAPHGVLELRAVFLAGGGGLLLARGLLFHRRTAAP